MKLAVKCVECGKLLGIYAGDEFYLTFSSIGIPKNPLKVICKKCWERRQARK